MECLGSTECGKIRAYVEELEAWADSAVYAEREACAALCEDMQTGPNGSSEGYEGYCAFRIRKRAERHA